MWRFGIPDFIGNYVYFQDLSDVSHNTSVAAAWKLKLYTKTKNAVTNITTNISATDSINRANKFLSSVAANEREKEMKMVRQFCEETGQKFPGLQPYLNNPKLVYDNPEEFYARLTDAINIIRKGTTEYLNELKRIRRNMKDQTRTLEQYNADDYRYRLVGDISSFLNRLRGKYNNVADLDSYALKVQNMAMTILKETGIVAQISDGIDFASIGAAVLADIEKQVQAEIDKQLEDDADRDLSHIQDQVLQDIEKRYLNQIIKRDQMMSPVQRALTNIEGIDFARIVENGRQFLGIKRMELSDIELKKTADRIRKKEQRTKNTWIRRIRDIVSESKVKKDMSLLTFKISGTVNTKQGTINEFLGSIFSDGGTNVQKNAAVDILTCNIGFSISQSDEVIDNTLSSIANSISNSVVQDDSPSNLRDIREKLNTMNKEIDRAIMEAEEQVRNLGKFNLDSIFIYHESLKLYSTMETGRSSAFHGREMNILSYIDYMLSSSVSADSALAASREDLDFLGLNLMKGAIGESAKGPLEKYFSMYAGLLMFDDITNMAIEATDMVHNIQPVGPKITQIHLYNLNGVYVPASMLISFISDTVSGAGELIANGLAAQAHISTPSTNEAYEAWKSGNHRLHPEDWQRVAAESASNTKVSITFFAAFLTFINQLQQI